MGSDAQAFLNRLETDTDFRDALTSAPHPAGKVKIIKDAGFEFTSEELNAAMDDEGTSDEARQHAINAVSNVAPTGIQGGVVGFWMWFCKD